MKALNGWRLPLRLAWRDIMKYKGRSALAALLIFVPVVALAGMFTGLTTYTISDTEQTELERSALSARISFSSPQDAGDAKTRAAFPAAGRVVTAERPPTSAQIAKQAGAPAVEATDITTVFSSAPNGAGYTPTTLTMMAVDDPKSSVLSNALHLESGRLPNKPGEAVITRSGRISGLPDSGPVSIVPQADAARGDLPTPQKSSLTIVGRVSTRLPEISAVAMLPNGALPQGSTHSFIVAPQKHWSAAEVQRWNTYGADLQGPGIPSIPAPDGGGAPGTDVSTTDALFLAVATMAFIAVTALLAGPAFAASATRQRRSLGLVAINGGTRTVLRRMVLAQALLLGALTATAAAGIGSAAGVAFAKWRRLETTGIEPPADVRLTWMCGLIVVATVASLVAAFIPARAAGRTNLLQALRGQVSPRRVRRILPTIGVAGIILGTLLLYVAVSSAGNREDHKARDLLFAYLGVPLFFGGAVLAVPYVLMATGHLARFLPLTPRIAVREVSRQRTRATASIGAVLATVAICTGTTVFAASSVKFYEKTYSPMIPLGSAAITYGNGFATHQESAAAEKDLRAVSSITSDAFGLWGASHDAMPSLQSGTCRGSRTMNDVERPLSLVALDDAGLRHLRLTDPQRKTLREGGALHVGPADGEGFYPTVALAGDEIPNTAIQNGRVPLTGLSWNTATPAKAACSPFTVQVSPIAYADAQSIAATTPHGLIMMRSALEAHHVDTTLSAIAIMPKDGVSTELEHQVQAAATMGNVIVERGPHVPLLLILGALTAGLSALVLLTTVVSTLLNDAESQADSATLATVGAPRGMRRRIVGAHAATIGFIGAAVGIVVGMGPGLVLAKASTGYEWRGDHSVSVPGTYVIPWWPLAIMLIGVPLIAALISMVFARRNPTLTRREA